VTDQSKNINAVVDKLFRKSYGKLIALLLSKYGMRHLELIENAIMESFYKAMKTWPLNGIPSDAQAWLYRTANNSLIDNLRRAKKISIDDAPFKDIEADAFGDETIKDPELKLLFLICHPELKKEDQLVFMLKTLSGFGDHEISHALMQKKATIKKRLLRTKAWIKSNNLKFNWPSESELKSRLSMVHKVLYLLFNEGFYSSHPEFWIRKDLCVEAMRLCKYLVDHRLSNYETNALMSLMCYHISRYESRIDDNGQIILLPDQDRATWNQYMIKLGNFYLKKSASDTKEKSIYQIEAFISAQHCLAKDFKSTDWKMLKELYTVLYKNAKQDFTLLNLVLINLHMHELEEAKQQFESINLDDLKSNKTTYYLVGMKLYEKLKDQMQLDLMLEMAMQETNGTKESLLINSIKTAAKKQ